MPTKKKSEITERSITPLKKTVEMTKENNKRVSSVATPKQDSEDKKKEETKTAPKGKKERSPPKDLGPEPKSATSVYFFFQKAYVSRVW